MDRNKAHDVLHVWNGNKAENCPVCNGTLKDDAEIVNAAQEVAAQNYYPRINPNLDYSSTIMCDENGNPIKKDDKPPVKADEDGGEKTEAIPPKKDNGVVSVMTDVMSFSEDKRNVPSRIKVVPVGKFKTQAYGEIEITKDKLLDMKKNFESGVRAGGTQTGLPIDIEHGSTLHKDAAAGWMKNLDIQDDGAYADVEWTPLGKDLLESGQYKFYSPEFHFEYVDPEQSFVLDNVMTGGGLVNKPMFKHDLPPIVMSEEGVPQNLTKQNEHLMLFITNQSSAEVPTNSQSNSSLLQASEKEEKPMDLQNILTKEKSARTSDEQVFVAQNLSQLTDEQKVAEGFVVAAPEAKVEAPADAAPQAPVEAAPAVEPAPAAPVVASENGAITAAEAKILKEAAEQGKKYFAELQKQTEKLQRIEITDKVKAFVFSEKGGKIAPAQVEETVDLMLSMSEQQRTAFTNILESLPERQIFGEKGSDQDLDKSQASDILTAKAQDLVKTSKENGVVLAFGEALKRVTNENPELYMESLKVKNG